ncbi:Ribosomal oxygenase 1 [Cryptotermes secundus]|uniref:Bifunctional lysine-specific demethylase and histidyl-hydroxylase n=1 Tax=Cryptotermes secundus TaxID=105785 RepID=A0A2J7PKZ5_9NEOP|nr:Ribosomal oxygenase 1 [Cryptotermes secundus]
MSPSKDDISAFAVYSSKKSKRKRNRKSSTKTEETEDMFQAAEEPDVEEILSTDDDPSASSPCSVKDKRKRKKSNISFTVTSEQSRTPGAEIVDVEENSDDVLLIENATQGKKKKIVLNPENEENEDQEVIFQDFIRKKTNGVKLKRKPTKGMKKGTMVSEDSSVGQDVFIVEDVEDAEEDNYSGNSLVEGKKLFAWLINPVVPEVFFRNAWEKRPLHIKRGVPEYYKPIISTPDIDKMLRNYNVQFTKNLDVTSYSDGKRETHNPVGRALPSIVWDYYKNGCSVRLLNPQTFIPKLALLNSSLQEYFGCFVGANVYLTPPDSQGFAPHYDDIEAFILQVEGQKHWKLYPPKSESETLPRFSSGNFSQDEIGDPIMEITLKPGDLLYFPRGTIHQGRTVPGIHSLHVTLSCYQRNTWGDLMEKVITAAVRVAMEENIEFRRGLPQDYLNFMGVAHSDKSSTQRTDFIEKIKSLMAKLFDHAPIDAAVDQMGKQFIHDALPPMLTAEEKQFSCVGDGLRMGPNGEIISGGEITLDTKIKLLRAHVIRLVTEEDNVRVYHTMDNSFEYHREEPQYLEISFELAPAVEHLICSYPDFVKVSDLPLDSEEPKVIYFSAWFL